MVVIKDEELFKLRYDYAFKWFEYHAKQRMNIFYYFLIITGILFNSFVLSIKFDLSILSYGVSIIGIFQAFAFLIFDIRNRQLISYSEDILEKLERETLFPYKFTHSEINNGTHLGLLYRDRENNMREGQKIKFDFKRTRKMKWWMRILYIITALIFFGGLLYISLGC